MNREIDAVTLVVAPIPAWGGRMTLAAFFTVLRCPHTRLGRTLDPYWDLRQLETSKSVGVLPMGADAAKAASC